MLLLAFSTRYQKKKTWINPKITDVLLFICYLIHILLNTYIPALRIFRPLSAYTQEIVLLQRLDVCSKKENVQN